MKAQQQQHRQDLSAIEENSLEEDSSSPYLNVVAKETPKRRRPKKDEKLVFLSRSVVVGVLMVSAFLIASMTYYTMSKGEYEDFKAEFRAIATQVFQMAEKNVAHTFESVQGLAHGFTSAAHQSGVKLPLATMQDFEAVAHSTRAVSKAAILAYAPLLTTATELRNWNAYSVNHSYWIEQGREQSLVMAEKANTDNEHNDESEEDEGEHDEHDDHHDHARRMSETDEDHHATTETIADHVFELDIASGHHIASQVVKGRVASPLWQMTPVPDETDMINFNLASNILFDELLSFTVASRNLVLSKLVQADALFGHSNANDDESNSPASVLLQPVFDELGPEGRVVGTVAALIHWTDFFNDVLSADQSGIHVVADICGQNTTFAIEGAKATFVGTGDHHDNKYDALETFFGFGFETKVAELGTYCHQHIHIFATRALEERFRTSKPRQYATVIVAMFAAMGLVFLTYDWFVSNRQFNTEVQANKSSAIVEELFPCEVAERLFESRQSLNSGNAATRDNLGSDAAGTKTIAELYPAATVLFADIAGFTAWSSMKDPDQVFKLLESIFQAFDAIAKSRGIYKVETIGDCYVAVCGVPKPDPEHVVHMCRFAMSAMKKFYQIISDLQSTLGPDTVELGMRCGLHSGPVTAGVLRGDRARFQLFGDTVNTASRIESTGVRERIHLSEQTALELIQNGKQDWIERREDAVEAKGKGKLVTYWLIRASDKSSSTSIVSSESSSDHPSPAETSGMQAADAIMPSPRKTSSATAVAAAGRKLDNAKERTRRLVDWNSELLLQLLKRIVARREALQGCGGGDSDPKAAFASSRALVASVDDEMMQVIEMPPYVSVPVVTMTVSVSDDVATQLHNYVTAIAAMYNKNPFHNFEHASHVTMSVHKLLSRLIAPKSASTTPNDSTVSERDPTEAAYQQRQQQHYEQTYGISSDPLVQFAVVLAALIHDLDHAGVPNAQLMRENATLSERYQGRSVAEQNSLDLAWRTFTSTKFEALRQAIAPNEAELCRLRQILVHAIMATDIFDPEWSAMRTRRWQEAFATQETSGKSESEFDDNTCQQRHLNQKATIVVEHLIQASDVAHTMQHWHIYQKWNQRLFNEMYRAFVEGRADADPSIGWFDGELWFFDQYVLPLAQKLKDCSMFGACSDEYLTYALDNRREWAEKGKEIAQSFVQDYQAKAAAAATDADKDWTALQLEL